MQLDLYQNSFKLEVSGQKFGNITHFKVERVHENNGNIYTITITRSVSKNGISEITDMFDNNVFSVNVEYAGYKFGYSYCELVKIYDEKTESGDIYRTLVLTATERTVTIAE